MKKIISLIIAVPALIVTTGNLEDNGLWWTQFVALGAVIAVLVWNGAFKLRRSIKW